MLSLIFGVLLFFVFGKVLLFGIRAAWGISSFLLSVVFLPLLLVGMVLVGLVKLALPIVLIIGLVVLMKERA